MKVFVQGHEVALSKTDFLASGGEAQVFVKGDTAYKLYHDASRAIPTGKVQELSTIADPRVIRPVQMVTDRAGTPLGYTMRYVPSATVLCQLFPRSFRERTGLTPDKMLALVRALQQTVHGVHAAGILVVDLNEMNAVADDGFGDIYLLDADSFQTPHYPATALMESIRDRHMRGPRAFDTGTDWFAFAVVAFQMLVGIHPYKGRHATLKTLDARMQADVSVLRAGQVRVPLACYPFTVIPPVYLDWFKAVLDGGKRVAPPETLVAAVTVITPTAAPTPPGFAAGLVVIEEYEEPVSGLGSWLGNLHVQTERALYTDGMRLHPIRGRAGGWLLSAASGPVVAWVENHRLGLDGAHPMELDVDEAAGTSDGRLYIRCHDQILEVQCRAGMVMATTACLVLPKATRLFPGGAYQDLLGMPHLTVFPTTGTSYTVPVLEWKGHRLVDLRCARNVAVAVMEQRGTYHRFVLRFTPDFSSYDLRKSEDVSSTTADFAVLDTGVVALLAGDDALELFSSRKGSGTVRRVEDPALGSVWGLHADGGRLLFFRDKTLYQLQVR